MRQALFGISAYVLLGLAFLCVGLALIPLLYPITAALAAFVFLSALALLFLYPEDTGPSLKALRDDEANAPPRKFSGDWIERYGPTRRAWRAARLSLASVLIVFLLYGALRLHHDACYLATLNEELNPLREAFRQESRRIETDGDEELPAETALPDEKPNPDESP